MMVETVGKVMEGAMGIVMVERVIEGRVVVGKAGR